MKTIRIQFNPDNLFMDDETPELTDRDASIAAYTNAVQETVQVTFPKAEVLVSAASVQWTQVKGDLTDDQIEAVRAVMTEVYESGTWYREHSSLALALEQSGTVRADAGNGYICYVSERDGAGWTVSVAKGMMPPHKRVDVLTTTDLLEQVHAFGVADDAVWTPLDGNGDPIKEEEESDQ